MRSKFLFVSSALCLILVGVVLSPAAVDARGLRATIHLTQAKIPANLTERGLVNFSAKHSLRANAADETTEAQLDSRKFIINMVTEFSQPINDFQFDANIYDIDDGHRGPSLINIPVMLSKKTDKVVLYTLKLSRAVVKPQRKYELVVVVRTVEVGSKKFQTLGEKKRNSGVVDFGADGT